MPCHVDISPSQEANHFQVLLCQACKFLSKKQIESLINPSSGLIDGLEWYSKHLMCDYRRKCFKKDVLNFDFETNKNEREQITKELNRIGYDLIISEGIIELIYINR